MSLATKLMPLREQIQKTAKEAGVTVTIERISKEDKNLMDAIDMDPQLTEI